MKTISRLLATAMLAMVLASPALMTGCAEHHYRVYDPYYNGYRDWNHGEDVYYTQWEAESHKSHVDYRKRNADEQKQYWDWRHNHAKDYDHDGDNDKH